LNAAPRLRFFVKNFFLDIVDSEYFNIVDVYVRNNSPKKAQHCDPTRDQDFSNPLTTPGDKVRLKHNRRNRSQYWHTGCRLEAARVMNGRIKGFEQKPNGASQPYTQHQAQEQDQSTIRRTRSGRRKRRLKNSKLLAELFALEIGLHAGLLTTRAEVLE